MTADVYLVNAPYSKLTEPSAALGALKACLVREGLSCEVRYLNIDWADEVGVGLYHALERARGAQLAEWTFASALFPYAEHDEEAYFEEYVAGTRLQAALQALRPEQAVRETLLRLRQHAVRFVGRAALEIVAARPKVVGCTTCYQQQCASLALLQRVRELDDEVVTILGGANCAGAPAAHLLDSFPFLDYVVSGEADLLFPPLVRRLRQEGRRLATSELPEGVLGGDWRGALPPHAAVERLDELPVPDHSDFFARIASTKWRDKVVSLGIEAGRGCAWAWNGGCTFCAAQRTRARHKSAGQLADEMETLAQRHGVAQFYFMDEAIHPGLVKALGPELNQRGTSFSLAASTRVTSHKQMAAFAEAGFAFLQVGIESFHDALLTLMNKGATALQNIDTLRAAQACGVRVAYNIMFGFPGDEDSWYLEMSRLMPLLFHLESPLAVIGLDFDHHSSYFHEQERYGLTLEPLDVYRHIYLLPPASVAGLAQHHQDRRRPSRDAILGQPGVRAVVQQCREWQRLASAPEGQRPILQWSEDGSSILDTRPCARRPQRDLDDLERRVLGYCDVPRARATLPGALSCDPALIDETLDGLLRDQLVVTSSGQLLALPVAPGRPGLG